jgi:hypothetical protein
MDVLISDISGDAAAAVVRTLEAHGHRVHACKDAMQIEAASPCAALRGADCPLDAQPVDVAIRLGPEVVAEDLGRGDICALRRRIPLVLVDSPGSPLERWACASVTSGQLPAALSAVAGELLPVHTAEARRAVREQLTMQGLDGSLVAVDVRRRNGGLLVDLRADGSLARGLVEQLSVHATQCIRRIDRWARYVDVSIHTAGCETTSGAVP